MIATAAGLWQDMAGLHVGTKWKGVMKESEVNVCLVGFGRSERADMFAPTLAQTPQG